MKALAAILALSLAPQESKPLFNSYLGKAPPELVGGKELWLNADGAPGRLKGDVVLVVFTSVF